MLKTALLAAAAMLCIGSAYAQTADSTDVAPGTRVVRQLYAEDGWTVREVVFDATDQHSCILRRGNIARRFQITVGTTPATSGILLGDPAIDWASGTYTASVDSSPVADFKMIVAAEMPHTVTAKGVVSPDRTAAFNRFAWGVEHGQKLTFDFPGDGTHKRIHFAVNLTGINPAGEMLNHCAEVITAGATESGGV